MNTTPFYRAVTLWVALSGPLLLQAASTIQFSATAYTVAESAGTVALTVQRTNDLDTLVSVDYACADGTAANGLKYTAVSGTLAFGAGETNKHVTIPILNEGSVEGTKTFVVTLTNPATGALLGTRTNATVRITDNDQGIQLQWGSYSVAEDAGAVLIGVVRDDDGALPVTVDLATSDLTATDGLDYVGITNTLSFAPQKRLKLIPLPIFNNTLKQPSRNFQVKLANPAGTTLGAQKTATVTILDNDQGFQFQTNKCSVAEDAGAALIHVLRGTDDTNSAATVDCATTDGSATNGVDYLGYSSTGADYEAWMHFEPLVEARGFLYCYPDGTVDPAR